MKSEDNFLVEALAALPLPELPPSTSARTLARARGHLVPPAPSQPRPYLQRIPAQAVPAFLLSADIIFVADACLKMARVFGG
jgi:hypothetical protein